VRQKQIFRVQHPGSSRNQCMDGTPSMVFRAGAAGPKGVNCSIPLNVMQDEVSSAQSKEVEAAPVCNATTRLFSLLHAQRHRLCSITADLIQDLHLHLNEVQATDLGLHPSLAGSISSKSGVGYQLVHSGPDMTLCIFILRRGSCIPLHDHPDMHVLARLLFGKLRVVSFDKDPCDVDDTGVDMGMRMSGGSLFATGSSPLPSLPPGSWKMGGPLDKIRERSQGGQILAPASGSRLRHVDQGDGASAARYPQRGSLRPQCPTGPVRACLHSDLVLGPSAETFVLGPAEGNLHELHAIEDCAFFDIVVPPYDSYAGRECTYYSVVREDTVNSRSSSSKRYLLAPTGRIELPMESMTYQGPCFGF